METKKCYSTTEHGVSTLGGRYSTTEHRRPTLGTRYSTTEHGVSTLGTRYSTTEHGVFDKKRTTQRLSTESIDVILNTNYHELVINFSDSRLYDKLYGNYMFYLNTNYHELFINLN